MKQVWSHRKVRIVTYISALLLLFYVGCVYHLEPNVIGIKWNPLSGQIQCDTVGGYYVSVPWEFVSRIDVRPIRVCLSSTANAYSCALVTFDKTYWRDFIDNEGFAYYWWRNRFSYNFGYTEEYRGWRDVLRGYAYGNTNYKFLQVERDYMSIP